MIPDPCGRRTERSLTQKKTGSNRATAQTLADGDVQPCAARLPSHRQSPCRPRGALVAVGRPHPPLDTSRDHDTADDTGSLPSHAHVDRLGDGVHGIRGDATLVLATYDAVVALLAPARAPAVLDLRAAGGPATRGQRWSGNRTMAFLVKHKAVRRVRAERKPSSTVCPCRCRSPRSGRRGRGRSAPSCSASGCRLHDGRAALARHRRRS